MKTKSLFLLLSSALGIAVVALNLLPSRSQAQTTKPLLPRDGEHYKVVGVADDDPAGLEAKLNALGAEGWKLRTSFNGDQFRGLIFAR